MVLLINPGPDRTYVDFRRMISKLTAHVILKIMYSQFCVFSKVLNVSLKNSTRITFVPELFQGPFDFLKGGGLIDNFDNGFLIKLKKFENRKIID